jgi:hypothetical protein
MRPLVHAAVLAVAVVLVPASAQAGGWNGSELTGSPEPVLRARVLLKRARLLEDTANTDDKAVTQLEVWLPELRKAVQDARKRGDAEAADTLDADLVTTEAELTLKRRLVTENRRTAHELRVLAARIAKVPDTDDAKLLSDCKSPPIFRSEIF